MQTFDHSELRADDLQRINVVGISGSGKTRFSRQLAETLGTPL